VELSIPLALAPDFQAGLSSPSSFLGKHRGMRS
jgi:hypothetical protein